MRPTHLLATLFFSALVLSAQTPAPSKPTLKPYVTADQLNAISILPAPPSPTSWQTLEELAELHRIEQTRTPAQVAHAQADDKEETMFLFADILGPAFNRAALPQTALLSDHVKANESPIVNPAKNFFARPRPYMLDKTLHPVCRPKTNPADYSYPSGHGVSGYLEALVLIQMLPERREAILARADDYALSREICGEHYPSDEAASKLTAHAVIGLMFSNPGFQSELKAATAELRAAYPASASK